MTLLPKPCSLIHSDWWAAATQCFGRHGMGTFLSTVYCQKANFDFCKDEPKKPTMQWMISCCYFRVYDQQDTFVFHWFFIAYCQNFLVLSRVMTRLSGFKRGKPWLINRVWSIEEMHRNQWLIQFSTNKTRAVLQYFHLICDLDACFKKLLSSMHF